MAKLPPLEFTLDDSGFSLEQIGAILKYQQQLNAKRAAREAAAARPAPAAHEKREGIDQ